jgi:hypothetical protein
VQTSRLRACGRPDRSLRGHDCSRSLRAYRDAQG